MNHLLSKLKKGELIRIKGSSLVGSVNVILLFFASAITVILESNSPLAFEWLNLVVIFLYLLLPASILFVICFHVWSKKEQRHYSSYYISKAGKLKVNLWKEIGWLLSLGLIFLIILVLSEIVWINKSNKEVKNDTSNEVKPSEEAFVE